METFVALYIFTVTFDWFNVLLLTKSNFFKKKKKAYWPQTLVH